ncbi:protein spaetzle-like [Armigeres subalbatus]|uniref:protein spaetzle-like n=1 Tax=Armigeres subalbatus TaxID=124917 RepID=UPI002ED4DC5E
MFALVLLVLLVTPSYSFGFWPLVRSKDQKVLPRFANAKQGFGNTLVGNTNQQNSSPGSSTVATPPEVNYDFMFVSDVESRIDKTEDCNPDYPICTNVIDYPQQLVNDIIARQEYRFAEVFGDDVVIDNDDTLEKRFDTSDDEFLCTSIEKLVHPQSGYTIHNKLVMIVNTPSYMQGVRIETCRNPGKACHKLEHLVSLYSTECKQLYHYRTLLAFDALTKQPYKESFRLPSCCKCVIKPLQRLHL